MSIERKRAVLAAVREELARELAAIERAAKDAWEGATHEENRPEHGKDMRSTEASYVAIGQSARARELADAIARLASVAVEPWAEGAPVGVGALVRLEPVGEQGGAPELWVMILLAGGGVTVGDGEDRVRVVTPQAPLGEALMGASVDDEITVGARSYEIIAIF
jgi:transcription elongation GreA/GreB family factor